MIDKPNFIILICGLPGTGKTTAAAKLVKALQNFILIDQTQVRRQFGNKTIPATAPARATGDKEICFIDRLIAQTLQAGQSIVYESANRLSFRRHQVYGIASSQEAQVLVVEVVCPEDIAKARMIKRPKGDNLLSDPNDPSVYDKLKSTWEDVESVDFKYAGLPYVSYVQYNSSENKLKVIIESEKVKKMIARIETILTQEK